jgi:ABC-type lipoprotein release transport system permease subunit
VTKALYPTKKHKVRGTTQSIKIGFFLAIREVRKANKWTTVLIISVMVLTFLNLIVLSGVLVGLIQGSTDANKERYTSDVIVSTLLKKTYIEQSQRIIDTLRGIPGVEYVTARYVASGRVEANYKNRTRLTDNVDQAAGLIVGINPEEEDIVTGLSKFVKEGEYLDESDTDEVLIGGNLLFKYTPIESPGFQTLKNVEVGSKVRLVVEGKTREVTIKGIIKSKVGEVDQRIYMVDRELRKLIGRNDFNVDEIVAKLSDSADPKLVKGLLVAEGFEEYAKIQTWEEAQPKFLNDIKVTFSLLGNLIGSIGLAVACITIFIIIFVNAITRRRFIGILKGIGIRSAAIEYSYVIQSLFYAVCGIFIGSLIVFLFLQPYIAAHPINFPFSDGILVATPIGTTVRASILLIATLIAGYIPARIVVKQNTLDAILGR